MNQPIGLKYRNSARLVDVRGQPHVVELLRDFLQEPYSRSWLWWGETGTGKSFTAYALAHELGIDTHWPEIGGFYQINSGEATKESVRAVVNGCHLTPLYGSGWKIVCVNEVDKQTDGAETVWLDALELDLPRTVIVFTTNEPMRLSQRFRDRCECIEFEWDINKLREDAQALVDSIWILETGDVHPPTLDEFGLGEGLNGALSFRRLIGKLETKIRSYQKGKPDATKKQTAGRPVRSPLPALREV